MKKTICSILAILFIASLSTLGYAANRSNISIDPPTEDLAIQLAQQPVLEAYEQLSNKMGIVEPDDSRFPNYPNHFGGAYYSDGELVLCITENTEEVREYYTNLIPDFKLIRFEHVTNSYNDLYNLQMKVSRTEGLCFSSIYVDVYENLVQVSVPDVEERDRIFYNEDILKTVLSPSEYSCIYQRKAAESVPTSEVRGGHWLYNPVTIGSSIGLCGTRYGAPVVLTAGHCVVVGDSYYYHQGPNGTLLGNNAFKTYSNYGYYDYGMIVLRDDYQAYFTLTSKVLNSSTYTTITSHLTTNTALVGTSISKYGAYGYYASGTISAVNASVGYNTGVTIYGLMKITLTNGSIVSGDSGGPVYSGTKFYGVVSGMGDSATVWASPVYSSSGFSILY